jgi:hypothetical protein
MMDRQSGNDRARRICISRLGLCGGERGHLARFGFVGDAGGTPALPFVLGADNLNYDGNSK